MRALDSEAGERRPSATAPKGQCEPRVYCVTRISPGCVGHRPRRQRDSGQPRFLHRVRRAIALHDFFGLVSRQGIRLTLSDPLPHVFVFRVRVALSASMPPGLP